MRIVQGISRTILSINIYNIGVPEREEREQKIKNLFEKVKAKNFLNLKKIVV